MTHLCLPSFFSSTLPFGKRLAENAHISNCCSQCNSAYSTYTLVPALGHTHIAEQTSQRKGDDAEHAEHAEHSDTKFPILFKNSNSKKLQFLSKN